MIEAQSKGPTGVFRLKLSEAIRLLGIFYTPFFKIKRVKLRILTVYLEARHQTYLDITRLEE
jgi:Gpi18-like mannosyltransferase